MPWHRDFSNLKRVTIFLWITAILVILPTFSALRYNQVELLERLEAIQSDMKISTEATRTAVQITQDDVNKLKQEMDKTTQELQKAKDKLMQLDSSLKGTQ